MNPSPHSHGSRADEYATNDTESRMSSGSETEEGSPTRTTPTEAGGDGTNDKYRLVYVGNFSAPNDPEALRLAQNVLNDVDSNAELHVRASGNWRAIANPEGFQYERKCKEKNRISTKERKMIEKGNRKVHEGNCLLDAVVLKFPGGPGEDTYKRLYGMAPDKVEEITHDGIIAKLNQHATTVANTRRKVASAYLDDFDKFIAAIKKERTPPGSDLSPRVRAAYDALKRTRVYQPKGKGNSSKQEKG